MACSAEQGAEPVSEDAMSRIEGTVFYRERMLLPPSSQVEVQLEDISRADAPAEVLASVLIIPEGGPPYPFVIDYAAPQIDQRMRYALRARIEHEGRLLFTNTEYIDPFGGNPVEILVQRIPSTEPTGPSLEGTEWELESLTGSDTLQGAGGRAPDLMFDAEQQRAAGFSGCNRYFGGYSRDGNPNNGSPLSFGQMAGTMMACAEGDVLERAYLQALSRVNAFRIVDGQLQLLENDQLVASFRARQ
jgi:putative lipoprotein